MTPTGGRVGEPTLGALWGTRWLAWGMGLFIPSGVIWVAILIPVQILQARMARRFAAGGVIPARYWLLGSGSGSAPWPPCCR